MDKPVRKIIRLENYDYSKNGLYFITICTVHKNELLWATDVGDGAPDVPLCCAHAVGKVYLSSFGKIIRDNIHRANSVYDDKKILQYVIMPNHIHFILKIGAGVSGTSRAPSPTIGVNTLFICRGEQRSPVILVFLNSLRRPKVAPTE